MYNMIMTYCMFPLLERKNILKGVYFDNPRTMKEIEIVANILREAYTSFIPFSEIKDTVLLEKVKDTFYEKYKDNETVQLSKKDNHYKNIYYHLAKNWVIVRFDSQDGVINEGNTILSNEEIVRLDGQDLLNNYKNYVKTVKFINLLTFISLENNRLLEHSLLIPECFDFFQNGNDFKAVGDLFWCWFPNYTNTKENLDDFTDFMSLFTKLKQNEKFIIERLDDPFVIFIADNLEVYRHLDDDKMKIVSLVSMIELLIAHKPNGERYNIDDSIRKQFCNKILLILHLNNALEDLKETEKLLIHIYDLRSAIAHGNFESIGEICEKIYIWRFHNDKTFIDTYNFCVESDILHYINGLLQNYLKIILTNSLLDSILFEIIKK